MFFRGELDAALPVSAVEFLNTLQKVSTFFVIQTKIVAPRGGSTMRDSKTALACVVKEHLNRGAFYLAPIVAALQLFRGSLIIVPGVKAARHGKRDAGNY
jgi:hypothetical protein